MRRLNVLPAELSATRPIWWEYDPALVREFWICSALLLGLFTFIAVQQIQIFVYNRSYVHQKDTEQKVSYELYEQRERVALIRSSLESLEEERSLLDQKLRYMLKHNNLGPFWSQILTTLSDILVEKTTLRLFEGSKEHIRVEGEAPDPKTINSLIGSMNQKQAFHNIRLNYTEIQKSGEGNAYRFEIASDIR